MSHGKCFNNCFFSKNRKKYIDFGSYNIKKCQVLCELELICDPWDEGAKITYIHMKKTSMRPANKRLCRDLWSVDVSLCPKSTQKLM